MTLKHSLAFAAILLATVHGCVQPTDRLPRTVRQGRELLGAETYRVLETGLGAAEDGYTFLNDRFRFEFSEEFDDVDGLRTAEERYERGKAASEFLSGGYDFVGDLFGIEAAHPIRVVIAPTLDGEPDDAKTETSWLQREGLIVQGSHKATMYFGAEAFSQPAVLAHELTHALLNVYGLPAWLGEGIATLVEVDYAGRRHRASRQTELAPIGLDEDGYNILQTWRGDGSPLEFRSHEAYAAALAIVREIRARFGDDVFPLTFQEIGRRRSQQDSAPMNVVDVVQAIRAVTGKDARPFFEEIRFRVDGGP